MKNKQLSLDYICNILSKKGLLSKDDQKEALSRGHTQKAKLQKIHDTSHSKRMQQVRYSVSPIEVLASFGFRIPNKDGLPLSDEIITETVAAEAGLEFVKIDPLKLNLEVVTSHIPRPFALRHLVVPISENGGGTITVAVADPFDLAAIESLRDARRLKIKVVLSTKSDIEKTIREFFGFRASIAAAAAEISSSSELSNLEQYVRLKGQNEIEANDQHIVNAVEYLLQYAFEQRASDIHIEPKKDKSLVRMRIDGILHYIHTLPKSIHAPVASRVKMLSRMDIAEKRRPQDGRIKTNYRGKDIEIRVSTLPVVFR